MMSKRSTFYVSKTHNYMYVHPYVQLKADHTLGTVWECLGVACVYWLASFLPVQRKFALENGYFENPTKPDFWDKFVEFANSWNKIGIPNKWAALRIEDESKFNESLETARAQ